jgi:hypothetical protein
VNTSQSQSTNNPQQQAADDAWLDEALAQTFPASDPVPTLHRSSQATNFKHVLQQD